MERIIYINGEFKTLSEAKISVFDRGFLFADSVYEVSAVVGGRLIDNQSHINRLKRSLTEIGITHDINYSEIISAQEEIISKNNINEGIIYIQITRGEEEREFTYSKNIKPNIVIFSQVKNILQNPLADIGVKLSSFKDIRWARRDIKSTALLAQVIAKNYAKENNAYEAIMYDEDGFVTEGGSSNIFIIKNNTIITRKADNDILKGITREAIINNNSLHKLNENENLNLDLDIRNFTLDEAKQADECFITSASNFVIPVIQIDDVILTNGKPGKNAKALRELYIKNMF
jgi:D-alanine transaminase